MSLFPQDPLSLVLYILLFVGTLIQLYYLLIEFTPFSFRKAVETKVPAQWPAVSVVICARNELKNLRSFLPLVLDQEYPDFQVVVVNDCSWDESGTYLEEMAKSHPRLKVVTIEEQEKYQHGKKFALTLGIKGAAHELLIMTDADCRPSDRKWIQGMVAGFINGKDLVIGYGAYERMSGILNKWIRFDTAMAALLYLSRALKGKAYMGVGRNLAYKKDLFFRNKGFAKHYHILSGDDDLFVNEVAGPNNTAVMVHPDSITISRPKERLSEWIVQRTRHLSAGRLYKSRDKRMLGIWHFSHFLFWISLFLALGLKPDWIIPVSVFGVRFLIMTVITWKAFSQLGEKDLIPFVLLFDILTAITNPLLAIAALFNRNSKWA
jgi:cellulose synthase/poly-beta-1,6-N-acetylglucosamine synthase-like glycosyltransferase